jgi:hypothetical protein
MLMRTQRRIGDQPRDFISGVRRFVLCREDRRPKISRASLWRATDVLLPQEKSTIALHVKWLNGQVPEEAGGENMVANRVSEGNAAHVRTQR